MAQPAIHRLGPQYQPISLMLLQGVALQLPPVVLSNHIVTFCCDWRAIINVARTPLQAGSGTPLIAASMLHMRCHAMPPVWNEKLALTSPAGEVVT